MAHFKKDSNFIYLIDNSAEFYIPAYYFDDKFKFDLEQEFMADNQKETVKQELDNYEKKLKDKNSVSKKLETEIDNMDSELPNYDRKREILNNRLNTVY